MSHRLPRVPLALGVGLLVAIVAAAGLAMAETAGQAPPIAAPPPAGQCAATGDKTAAEQVLAGQPAWVRLNLDIACSPVTAPLHVVLVQDGSLAMSGTLKNDLHAQAADVVRGLRMPTTPSTMVAAVEYNERAKRLLELTNDEAAAVAAVQRSGARGKTMIEVGIDEAVKVIEEGRAAAGDPADLSSVIVLMSNGRNEKGCSAAVNAASKAKQKNVLVMTSCVAADCEADCMRQIATTQRYFFFEEDRDKLIASLQRAQRLVTVSVKDLVIADHLLLPYQDGSGVPPPARVSPDRLQLAWRAGVVPAEGVTVTYNVETGPPAGDRPVSVEAKASYTNSVGWSGTFVFPVPSVRVLPWTPTSPPAATPTATATIAPTDATPTLPSPTPTIPPTAVASHAVYLPCLASSAVLGQASGG